MFLAWKELRHYKLKYGLITGILVLLTFMVLFLGGLANGLGIVTSATIEDSKAAYFVISEDSEDIINRSEITPEQYDVVKAKVDEATVFNLQRVSISKPDETTKMDCTYFAIDKDSFMMVDVTEGNKTLSDNEIILNDTFADEGIAIGDIVTDVASNMQLKVIGFTKNEYYTHSPVGVITLETHQEIKSKTTNDDTVVHNAIAIKDASIDNLDINGIKVLSKDQVVEKIPGHSQQQLTINMILLVLLVISAIILGVFFYIVTIQKIPQFGTLKAIGTPMKKLASMIIWQIVIIAGCSVLIGNLLTFVITSVMPNKMPFTLSLNETLLISVAFVIISVISSLFTLLKVAKVDPIIAIGGNE